MRLSYDPLMKMLVDKHMTKTELREATGISCKFRSIGTRIPKLVGRPILLGTGRLFRDKQNGLPMVGIRFQISCQAFADATLWA